MSIKNWRAYQLFGNKSEKEAISEMLETIGEKFGIYEAMTQFGAVNATELAKHTGVSEKFAGEWLEAQAARNLLDYDENTGRYCLWCVWPRTDTTSYAMAV